MRTYSKGEKKKRTITAKKTARVFALLEAGERDIAVLVQESLLLPDVVVRLYKAWSTRSVEKVSATGVHIQARRSGGRSSSVKEKKKKKLKKDTFGASFNESVRRFFAP